LTLLNSLELARKIPATARGIIRPTGPLIRVANPANTKNSESLMAGLSLLGEQQEQLRAMSIYFGELTKIPAAKNPVLHHDRETPKRKTIITPPSAVKAKGKRTIHSSAPPSLMKDAASQ
ncbi:MAG: hypothetical protein V3S39_05155, partial [Thermodesulfobacteriota bacterium]